MAERPFRPYFAVIGPALDERSRHYSEPRALAAYALTPGALGVVHVDPIARRRAAAQVEMEEDLT